MKPVMLCLICLLPFVTLIGCNSPTSVSGEGIGNIIAYYRLASSPNDILGKQAPMELLNTPFQEGGIYCNGIYYWSGDTINRCHASTPWLDSLNFQSFTISAWFKVKEIAANPGRGRPVIMGGGGHRWMGVIIRDDTTLSLLYNNSSYVHTSTRYQVDVWNKVSISYDITTQIGRLYFNNEMIASATFSLNHGNDRRIMITNFANGTTFLGILRDMKIYNEADTSLSSVQF